MAVSKWVSLFKATMERTEPPYGKFLVQRLPVQNVDICDET
jgi:hypothetical protein